MAQGTATVDFGAGKTDVSAAVSAPTITGGQLVEAWLFPTATGTNTADNHWFDDLQITAGNVSAGVGFTVYAKCRTGLAHGEFTVAWVFN